MNIFDYFESLRRSLTQNPDISFIEDPVELQAFNEHYGLFRARVYFWDQSHLTIDEVIDTSAGFPQIISYAYTYIRKDEHVFRYDNAPHYPELPTFPHHKHIGSDEKPAASEQPTLNQVYSEIGALLGDLSETSN